MGPLRYGSLTGASSAHMTPYGFHLPQTLPLPWPKRKEKKNHRIEVQDARGSQGATGPEPQEATVLTCLPTIHSSDRKEHGWHCGPASCFLLRLPSVSQPGDGSNCRPGTQALFTSGNTSTEANEAAFRVSRALGRELKIDRSLKMAGKGGGGAGGSWRGIVLTLVAVCRTRVH